MPSYSLCSIVRPLDTSWAPTVVWAFRLWVNDRSNWTRIVQEMVQLYGQDRACAVIRGLAMTISALRQHACRVIHHHPDGFPALTPDEDVLLAMIADVSAGRDPIERAHGLISPTGHSLLRTALYELAWALCCYDDSSISHLAAAE